MSENILIRGVNWVGDAVMTLPAIKAIRKSMPGRKLHLLVKPWVSPVFEKDPHIDEIILYDDRYQGIRGKYRLSKTLKEKGFSLAILLQNAFDAALITYLAGIPERIGYARDKRGFLLTKPIPYEGEDRKMHHIDYYLELLKRAGIDAPFSEPWLYLSMEERLWARDILKDMKRPVIGISPAASYGPAKHWRAERFAKVAKRIIKELNGSVVIFGKGITDATVQLSQISNDKTRLLYMVDKTTLRELIALISECDALLTTDSGPMHIGYAVKTPLIAIFGSTDPSLTGPVGKGNIVIKKDIECSPCFERECKKPQMRCMEEITAEEVFNAIKSLLPKNKAVFFDRDGTLCKEANYLNNWDDFKVFPEVSSLKLLKDNNFKLIGVTNQSGIARGIVDEGFVRQVNALFIDEYGFDDFYYCPHLPEEHCPCRKPEPEMLLQARVEHGIDLKGSYVVGDKEIDMLLAKAVGAKGILVQTGQERESSTADFIARDLNEAVNWILNTL
jgi:heptosyltransferase-2